MAKKTAPEPINKGGRPRVLVADTETLEKLKIIASRLHTQPEAAALFEVSLRTFEGFLRDNPEAREIWDGGQQTGRAAIRRLQFQSAQKGNVPMQIWLGKQYIGQKEKSEVENRHEIGESVKELWAMIGAQRRGLIGG